MILQRKETRVSVVSRVTQMGVSGGGERDAS